MTTTAAADRVMSKIAGWIWMAHAYRLFQGIRWIYLFVDRILDHLTGYSLIKGSAQERSSANGLAHYMDIVCRFNFYFALSNVKHMILKHNRSGD